MHPPTGIEKIIRKTEEAVPTDTGGKISLSYVREWKNPIVSANERGSSPWSNGRFVGRFGGGEAGRGVFPTGLALRLV